MLVSQVLKKLRLYAGTFESTATTTTKLVLARLAFCVSGIKTKRTLVEHCKGGGSIDWRWEVCSH